MAIRYPRPLRPGDTIGVTAPSSGVGASMQGRFERAVDVVRRAGFEVRLGACLGAERVVSAPRRERAEELMGMLLDPAVAAIVPPWGGELAIDLLDLLDFDALAAAKPTWVVGFSDLTTVMLPLTTRLGWATLHGHNLMDTPYETPEGLTGWIEALTRDPAEPLVQHSPGRYRSGGWDDYEGDPGVCDMTLDAEGTWTVLGGGDPAFSGRLIGGCIEVLSPLAGTPFADVPAFRREYAPEGTIVFLEAAEHGAYDVCRALHGLRLAGWFEGANGVLIGRTPGPDAPKLSQHEAVADALGGLGLPIVLDVEFGHVQPFAAFVAGAVAEVDAASRTITQRLA
ncbi:S66 family peptidase [Nocardioides acrostichi]|uniref:S66 family peptidase n=1 Tax=Nocardioides acrostichi TaxID=2784339 RepID=UPI001A9C32C1|nr:S66 peptidase family protein [Nocardioides acrostichi]